MRMDPFILFGIILALGLAFVNGLNDASHSIATVVATRGPFPGKSGIPHGGLQYARPVCLHDDVAATIGTAILSRSALTPLTIVVAMGSAIILIFVATRAGLPLSSSNAMVGGLLVPGSRHPASLRFSSGVSGHREGLCFRYLTGAVAGALVLGLVLGIFHEDIRTGLLLGAVFGAAITIPVMMVAGLLGLSGLLVIVLFILISPLLGMATAFLFSIFSSSSCSAIPARTG